MATKRFAAALLSALGQPVLVTTITNMGQYKMRNYQSGKRKTLALENRSDGICEIRAAFGPVLPPGEG
jgi:hypothetical protein